MFIKILVIFLINLFLVINTSNSFAAAKNLGDQCDVRVDTCTNGSFCQTSLPGSSLQVCLSPFRAGAVCPDNTTKCITGYSCQPKPDDPSSVVCQKDTKGLGEVCNSSYSICEAGLVCQYTQPGSSLEICMPPFKAGDICVNSSSKCISGYSCQPKADDPKSYLCQKSTITGIFGAIQPPDVLKGFLAKDPTGASAISNFLSNFVNLIFTVATIVFVFMIIWGAFDWLISGGDKEKLSSAQKKIINAIIGIILFAVAFAIIRVLGVFTGFTFFK